MILKYKTYINKLVKHTMKQLPDENTLLCLLELAQDAEQKAKALCDLTPEVDEKWRVRWESKRKVVIHTCASSDRFSVSVTGTESSNS